MTIYSTLITPEIVFANLQQPHWVIVDCRFNLMNAHAGQQAYLTAHLPSARYAHLDNDLASPKTTATGRHPLPNAAKFMQTLGAWGIDSHTQVILYDDCAGMMAGRLWWLLRWVGHHAVALLDGGLNAWQAAGYPLNAELPIIQPCVYNGCIDDTMWVDSPFVANALEKAGYTLIDARTPERFRGEQEPIDPVAGHIPFAKNYPLSQNLTPDGYFLSPEMLHARFSTLNTASDKVVSMCGSGITACHNLLAMEIAGLHGARLYVGSWSEWITHPEYPIATGD